MMTMIMMRTMMTFIFFLRLACKAQRSNLRVLPGTLPRHHLHHQNKVKSRTSWNWIIIIVLIAWNYVDLPFTNTRWWLLHPAHLLKTKNQILKYWNVIILKHWNIESQATNPVLLLQPDRPVSPNLLDGHPRVHTPTGLWREARPWCKQKTFELSN